MQLTKTRTRVGKRAPKVVINEAHITRFELLADAAWARFPELSDRLVDELSRARIVTPKKLPANVVDIGRLVTYRDDTTGEEHSVTPVFPEDADISKGLVSLMTPLGVALLGLAEGARFYWDARDGTRRPLTVIRVAPPDPDAPGAPSP